MSERELEDALHRSILDPMGPSALRAHVWSALEDAGACCSVTLPETSDEALAAQPPHVLFVSAHDYDGVSAACVPRDQLPTSIAAWIEGLHGSGRGGSIESAADAVWMMRFLAPFAFGAAEDFLTGWQGELDMWSAVLQPDEARTIGETVGFFEPWYVPWQPGPDIQARFDVYIDQVVCVRHTC